MSAPIPSVAIRSDGIGGLFMRVLCVLKRKAANASAVSAISCLALSGQSIAANYAVNVNIPTPGLAADFIASTTTQYLGTVTPSAFFSNTWNVVLTGKNPNYNPPPVASTPTVNADALLQALVTVSTSTYPYGWADGMEYGRVQDLKIVSYYVVNCSTPSVFDVSDSTGIWNSAVCTTALSKAYEGIYQMNFSTPTIIPGY